jgi:hypothetical protein
MPYTPGEQEKEGWDGVGTTYSKCPRDRVKSDVHFVNKISRVAHTTEGTSRIDVVLPSI